ncbi:hypothetical protein HMPREF9946_04250 [Acetobacteraceae bacterium AT-5844]|nr:hypothetical protein HMPREF9946_04250 [Acetobacteraceae bacterium AT-5844]
MRKLEGERILPPDHPHLFSSSFGLGLKGRSVRPVPAKPNFKKAARAEPSARPAGSKRVPPEGRTRNSKK